MKGLTLAELDAWKAPYQKYIIDNGILVPGTKLILFGRYQTWKSMLAVHTASCIATGRDWFGYRTSKSPCYVLQIENPQAQFKERTMKYAKGNNLDLNISNLWLCTEPYIKLDKGFGIAELDKELSRTGNTEPNGTDFSLALSITTPWWIWRKYLKSGLANPFSFTSFAKDSAYLPVPPQLGH